ncbi:MAG: DUF2914 domain-containing protein [Desulfosoma sp.]
MTYETGGTMHVATLFKTRPAPRTFGPRRTLRLAAAVAGLVAAFLLGLGSPGFCQERASPPSNQTAGLALTRAGICESVENLNPVNTAAVFSVTQGQIYCFTDFGTVRSQTVVYHRWYHRDTLTTQIRLKIYPPRWATYSMLKLREVDKGPWKVEITDAEGRVLSVLRFSIVD